MSDEFTCQAEAMEAWTVYFSPSDYPGLYVLRKFVLGDGEALPTDVVFTAETLEAVREFVPSGCVQFAPDPQDDSVIVETWL